MKRRVLYPLFGVLALLSFQISYAKEHPQTNHIGQNDRATGNSLLIASNSPYLKEKLSPVPSCIVSSVTLSNIVYTVDGQNYASLQAAVKEGKPVKVCFTVPASDGIKTYSLVSYQAPHPFFVREKAHLQVLFDYETIDVPAVGGRVCLEINVPDCYFQVDFVKGCILPTLGPASTNPNNFYGTQNRLITAAEGGTVPCVPGDEGCTPGYWKNHPGAWSTTGYSTGQTIESVFDVPDAYGLDNSTLLQALGFGGGPGVTGAAQILLRAAVAALLNASSTGVDYPRTPAQVIASVNAALASNNRDTMLKLATALDYDNNLGCSLNNAFERTAPSVARPDALEVNISKLSVFASPNPYSDRVRFMIQSPTSGRASLEVFNMLGQKVQTIFNGEVKAGVSQTFEYSVPQVHRTTLIYMLRKGDETIIGKLLQAKQ